MLEESVASRDPEPAVVGEVEDGAPFAGELVAEDVQQRYLISYSPANQNVDGAWRRIALTTSDPSHLVRTRAGYFAPKPPPVRPSLEFTVTDVRRLEGSCEPKPAK